MATTIGPIEEILARAANIRFSLMSKEPRSQMDMGGAGELVLFSNSKNQNRKPEVHCLLKEIGVRWRHVVQGGQEERRDAQRSLRHSPHSRRNWPSGTAIMRNVRS